LSGAALRDFWLSARRCEDPQMGMETMRKTSSMIKEETTCTGSV
jgi:hypothetical protein